MRIHTRLIHGTTALIAALVLCLAAASEAKAPPAKAKPATKSASAPKIPQTDIYLHPKPPIDSAQVHKLYLGGDFDEAIELLETAIKEKRNFSHGDSVFFCKHLGVMYAATYETREKGKYYMHLLLTVEPTARILDMYASDMIYMIFKNIQEEFEATRPGGEPRHHNSYTDHNQDTMPVSKTPPPKTEPKSSDGHAMVWVGATAAVVGAGVAAYLIFGDSPPAAKQVDHSFPGN